MLATAKDQQSADPEREKNLGAYMLLQPGPPLSQRTRGAVDASVRAEKNLSTISLHHKHIKSSSVETHQYHMCMVEAEFKSASR